MEESKAGGPPRDWPGNASEKGDVCETLGYSAGDASSIPKYELCASLVGHTGDVRSLASGKRHIYSGARDCTVKAWKLDEMGQIRGRQYPMTGVDLPDWVNALTVKGESEKQPESVIAGCKDGGIYVLSWQKQEEEDAKLTCTKSLFGHDAPVCSLSWNTEGFLLSGSWDETARAWDVEASECKWVLGGHENNVCVLGLNSAAIATGSTGIEAGGKLVGEQIRLWKGTPPKQLHSLTDHTSGIRDLCQIDAAYTGRACVAFCSASNDGTVRAWGPDGQRCGVYSIPGDSFVFSVRYLGKGIVASGDDGGNLCVLRLSDCTSPLLSAANIVYKHPNTVWSVTDLLTRDNSEIDDGPGDNHDRGGRPRDVATGCADCVVRVFTADEKRALRGAELKDAERAARTAGSEANTEGHIEVSGTGIEGNTRMGSLPSVSDMRSMVGTSNGQLSAFADDEGRAQVFRWVEASTQGETGTWESLGTLRPPVRKVALDGHLYDQIIPVEVESASRGFLEFQLGVNMGDDPEDVAAKFCMKHSLGPEYKPQIEQFVAMVIDHSS